MEDKEKQIEEMANILCESKEHNCNGEDCKCLKQATDLFNKGVRIIPKDSVVLSGLELADYKHYKEYTKSLAMVEKETVDKFTEKLENGIDKLDIILHEDNDEQYVSINQLLEFIDELAK